MCVCVYNECFGDSPVILERELLNRLFFFCDNNFFWWCANFYFFLESAGECDVCGFLFVVERVYQRGWVNFAGEIIIR